MADENLEQRLQLEKYKKKNLVMGIDEEEELRLAILASLESNKD